MNPAEALSHHGPTTPPFRPDGAEG